MKTKQFSVITIYVSDNAPPEWVVPEINTPSVSAPPQGVAYFERAGGELILETSLGILSCMCLSDSEELL